ncbi:pyrroloquinoline quinone precursor peptide PqqA [Rhodovibrio sodomensis]|uniref:Coenzyme PQQ synthesis protein A n=1 Tax=Rhodovibrio sodomensis TaxID=1088 RepID=A0ABS1DGF4_9PROT|nr:pyrroloquinoline quinone precursor peptide PqqA [Rhodovibrio sodomensis]MBK1669051.1 pyrroloquinoline quinone precursor peptide PqqA [Rhodovibrio sodomensis]
MKRRSADNGAKKVWSKPRVNEIAVGMEINAYACAESAR